MAMPTNNGPTSASVLATVGVDALLYRGDLRGHPPSVMVYGPSGSGKSTEMAIAASHALFVTTKPSVLHPYADWCYRYPELVREMGLRVPEEGRSFEQGGMDIIHLPEKTPQDTPFDTVGALSHLLRGLRAAVTARAFPWMGIVFDEWSVLMERIWIQCQLPHLFPWARRFLDKNGNFNPWGEVVKFMAEVVRGISAFATDTYRLIGAVAHESDPRYFDKMNVKLGTTIGEIKQVGGPRHPTPDLIPLVVADFDAILRLTLEEKRPASPFPGLGAILGGAPAAGAPGGPGGVGLAPEQVGGAPSGALPFLLGGAAMAPPPAGAQGVPQSGAPLLSLGGLPFATTPAPVAPAPAAPAPAPAPNAGAATGALAQSDIVIGKGYVETVEAVSSTGLVRRYQLERSDDYEAKVRAFIEKKPRKMGMFGLLEEMGYNMRFS